jgi:ketosteroid isomerase-like protein
MKLLLLLVAANAAAPCDLIDRRDALLKQATLDERSGNMLSALPALFARDGIYISAGALTYRGPEGAKAWLSRDTLNATSKVRMITVGGDVSANGEDGFTYGYLDGVRASGDLAPAFYHAYWRRDGDNWRIAALVRRRRPDGATTAPIAPRKIEKRACTEAAKDTNATAKEAADADRAFSDAGAASVADAFANFATADVSKTGKESGYIFGRDEVRKLFDPPPPQGLVWQPEYWSAARSGDLAFTIGVAGPRNGTPLATGANAAGHYFTIWRKDADGKWRYVID